MKQEVNGNAGSGCGLPLTSTVTLFYPDIDTHGLSFLCFPHKATMPHSHAGAQIHAPVNADGRFNAVAATRPDAIVLAQTWAEQQVGGGGG